ncbi:MAG: DcaP family trimeric outer membrane transporter [Rikenellaceae bacterium]
MKRIFLSFFALAATTIALGQSAPIEWKVGENTKVKIGGYVRFNMNADFDGSVNGGNDFISTNITDAAWDEDENLGFDVSATRLSLQITQSTKELGDVKLFVETDFRGSSVRLRQAYVEAKGFIAGQTWSFMTDLAANAPTVDINGVGSRTFLRTPLFGYRHSFSDALSAGISVEYPSLSTFYVGGYSAIGQTMPNIPLYIQAKGEAGHIKVGAMIRTLQYADDANKERLSQMGLGGQLSGSLKATKAVSLFGQAIYGKGINNYISDLSSLSINLMSTDGTLMEATPMGAASLGVSAKFAKRWTAALSGSMSENFGDKDYFDGYYQASRYTALSLFYAPAARMQLGAEYLNGSRTNFGDDAIGAQRFSLSVKYTL